MWACGSPSRRFKHVIFTPHSCVIVFGLVRTPALAATRLIAPYVNSDRILLAELALRGRLFEVPEFLFAPRDHPGCSIRSYPEPRARIVWFESGRKPYSSFPEFPEWNELFGYSGALLRSRLRPLERLSTPVHKYGNVFRQAAGRNASTAGVSFFINASRSSLVNRQSNGVAMDS
jgi:hypothetical protein